MGVATQQDSLWQAVLGEIELTVSHGNFVTWFKNTCLIKQVDDTVVIGVPGIFVKNQLEKKYCDLILEVLRKNGVDVNQLEFKMSNAVAPARPRLDDAPMSIPAAPMDNASGGQLAVNGGQNGQSGLVHSYRQGLNERYTFDSFIVGASNELAFAACQAVTQQPGSRYNPLFLYGGVGLGKTHLIEAAGNVLAAKIQGRVLYVTTEQFVQEFVDALRMRKTAEFTRHYRTADVLIVDDLQFIAGKEKVQEEFFHTFNALHQANKQIILSADRPPKQIPTLQDRLWSRFSGGMSIDMQVPDFETRCAIIQSKAQTHAVELEREVVDYLATNIQNNVRELEGALNQLLAYCEMRGLIPSLAVASSVLGVSRVRPKHLSARQIIERTARYYQISFDDIVGPKRDKDIVVPRQVAMYILRQELDLSFPKIARELGRKDHTTAIHSVDKIERESHEDASLRTAINEIKEQLYA